MSDGVPVAGDLEEAEQMSLPQIADALDRNGCGWCAPRVEDLADQVRRNWANAAVVQEVFSTLLRGMARRVGTLRGNGRHITAIVDDMQRRLDTALNERDELQTQLPELDKLRRNHDALADAYVATREALDHTRARVAAVRALTDDWQREAVRLHGASNTPAAAVAQHLLGSHRAAVRAALGGTTDPNAIGLENGGGECKPTGRDLNSAEPGPTAPECGSCGHERSEHDSAGVCRVMIRPTWAPDDECFCGRFVEELPVFPREDETPESAADPQPVNVDLLARMREGVTSREPRVDQEDGLTPADALWVLVAKAQEAEAAPASMVKELSDVIADELEVAEEARGSVSATPDPAALARWLYRNYGGGTTRNGDWHQPPWSDLNDTIRDAWITEANDAVRAALAGTATTTAPGLGAALDAIKPRPHISVSFDDGPGVACGCCEIDWQLCRGLYDKGMARCCSDCTHNLAGVPSALLGTWADPEFRAHQEHKHAVEGCGYCPTEEASDG